jgi:hypothetical protein
MTINKETAQKIVEIELSKLTLINNLDEIVIIDDLTIEKDFGWVFFYNSKAFLEKREARYMLIGNAPIIVDRESGLLYFTGTAKSIDKYIEEFAKDRKV